jgi:hypothetical protein
LTNVKKHFTLHFEPEHYVLYEEKNGKYYRAKWLEVAKYKDIKRIHYNTQKWKNYLIIDIDNDNLYKYREQGLPEPNFILKNKNKKGGHLFYVLDRGVYFKNTYYLNKWQILQKEFTRISGGDPLNKGYVGKFINSKHFEYIELNPFAYDIDFLASKINYTETNNFFFNGFIPETQKQSNKPQKIEFHEVITEGQRTMFLFEKTRKYAYIQVIRQKEQVFKNLVSEYINKLNNTFLKPQNKAEVKSITRSIIKYCLKNKNNIKNFSDEINRGVMNLKETNLTLKEKQKLASEYAAKQKNNKTLFKLQTTILDMKEKKLKINISSLAKQAGFSRNTVIKYKEKLDF